MEYKLVPVSKSGLRRFLVPLLSKDWWVTYRLPFQKYVRITYPDGTVNPELHPYVSHEIIHAKKFGTWWGPWVIPPLILLFPLPILFSSRWWLERRAYLDDIKLGKHDIESVVYTLWNYYGWCWPRSLMARWFIKQMAKL